VGRADPGHGDGRQRPVLLYEELARVVEAEGQRAGSVLVETDWPTALGAIAERSRELLQESAQVLVGG
jgi:hypothetical protein